MDIIVLCERRTYHFAMVVDAGTAMVNPAVSKTADVRHCVKRQRNISDGHGGDAEMPDPQVKEQQGEGKEDQPFIFPHTSPP